MPEVIKSDDPVEVVKTAAESVQKAEKVAADAKEQLDTAKDEARFTQEQLNALLAKERRDSEARFKDYDKLKSDAAELKKIQREKLSDDERRDEDLKALREENEGLKAAIAKRDLADLRREVAEAAGLPVKLAARLTGTSREELEADAAELKGLVPAPKSPTEGAPAEKLTPGGGGKVTKFDAKSVADSIPRNPF